MLLHREDWVDLYIWISKSLYGKYQHNNNRQKWKYERKTLEWMETFNKEKKEED